MRQALAGPAVPSERLHLDVGTARTQGQLPAPDQCLPFAILEMVTVSPWQHGVQEWGSVMGRLGRVDAQWL